MKSVFRAALLALFAFLPACALVLPQAADASAKWTVQTTPNPTGATSSELYGVSCKTSTACIAAGSFENSAGSEVPLAESWNGTAWTVQEPPKVSGAKESYLKGVACTSSTACVAVGYFENSAGKTVPLAESWNGTAWSAQEPPIPTGAASGELYGVSCASSTSCAAAGNFRSSAGTEMPLAARWNGTAWTAQEPPSLSGAKQSYLRGVSCTSSTACIAAGYFENSSAKIVPLAESWNGTTWTAKEPPSPSGAGASTTLEAISCTATTTCVAVGRFENSSEKMQPLAEQWNGTAWTAQSPSSPIGGLMGQHGVSCFSSSACIGVGDFLELGLVTPFAESWNGTTWTAQEPPSPTGAKATRLNAVSCTAATTCKAVGGYTNSSGKFVTLAERYE